MCRKFLISVIVCQVDITVLEPVPDGPCQAGYYCTLGVDTATPATGGSHTGTSGDYTVGHYCPLNTTIPIQCAAGTYINTTGIQLVSVKILFNIFYHSTKLQQMTLKTSLLL